MRYCCFILLVCMHFACKQNDKVGKPGGALMDSTYTIKGTVQSAADNEMVVLRFLGTEESDTTYTKGNNFEFKGKATEPLMALLFLPASINEQSVPLSFMVENAEINLEGNKDSLHQATVVGGVENTGYNTLKKILQLYDNRVKQLTVQAQNAQSTNDIGMLQNLQMQYEQTMTDRQMAIKQFALENPSSIAGAFFVNQDLSSMNNMALLDSIYQGFDSSIHNSLYVQRIKQTLDVARKTSVGQPAPELTLNDVNGKAVSVSSLKGKYVLVDFWASWCGPCREENPNVVDAYKKYKNKGFTVLGVSLDESKTAWQSAIKKDGLTWAHVSDLQGWKSSAAANYGVQSIPANFLLNKEGVIIARDLRQESLDSKLSEVLND